MAASCLVYELGSIDYASALYLQNALLSARQADTIPDTVLLLQHSNVITLGASGTEEHIVVPHTVLEEENIPIIHVDRGGSITYHGPGQLIGYFIMNLRTIGMSLREFLFNLEEIIISTLDDYSIKAHRDPNYRGVWVGNDKICAVGLRLDHGYTKHGFALNVSTDLRYFEYIVPCSIRDKGVTSVSRLLGNRIEPEEISLCLLDHCADIFDLSYQYGTGEPFHGNCECAPA
jgi:lipoyl(octanoyl) transferase